MESNSECFFGRMRALDLYMHDKSDARSLPVKEKKKKAKIHCLQMIPTLLCRVR